ncbi:transmembrane protein [Mycolicibacterium canariasense]|uniref:Transmembrane protein n=1 Tax=Mycolicibacterium canariasense TaxID=228230 RepID=A0A117IBK4_MYCCR|nr:DUF308 domain-containing protein [Mycolicibacterium canariasense]MCV7212992.1 DUF308 domain-containing protein [Mycolicibacterium canariasense]GAS98132.1 transmembrane protein [Mycolicibacterium canariasense]
MTETVGEVRQTTGGDAWLKRYYFARAAFSIVWVGAAVSLADAATAVVATLLLIYPAWDAAANVVDARRNGGLRSNPTQAFNTVVSSVTTIAVAVALASSMNDVLRVFGIWASLSGLLQLATAVRRWKSHGAQWPMIISGIQSTAAGVSFVIKAGGPVAPQVDAIAPYAAFGAFYFLISALWLTFTQARRRRISG